MCAPIHGISRYPGDRKTYIQGSLQHAPRQFWFGSEGHLWGHMGFLTTLLVVSPTLGQIQFAVQQCVSAGTGVGKKHAHLAVFDAPSCATVLSLNPYRFVSLFEKPGLVDH